MKSYRALLIFDDGQRLIRSLGFTDQGEYMPAVVTTRDENIHTNIRLKYSHFDQARKTAVYYEDKPDSDGPTAA